MWTRRRKKKKSFIETTISPFHVFREIGARTLGALFCKSSPSRDFYPFSALLLVSLGSMDNICFGTFGDFEQHLFANFVNVNVSLV